MNSAREHRDRVDLKDEEEDRMVGTVNCWLYWKYFRATLPTILIISLIIFFAIVQGRWSYLVHVFWYFKGIQMSHNE